MACLIPVLDRQTSRKERKGWFSSVFSVLSWFLRIHLSLQHCLKNFWVSGIVNPYWKQYLGKPFPLYPLLVGDSIRHDYICLSTQESHFSCKCRLKERWVTNMLSCFLGNSFLFVAIGTSPSFQPYLVFFFLKSFLLLSGRMGGCAESTQGRMIKSPPEGPCSLQHLLVVFSG